MITTQLTRSIIRNTIETRNQGDKIQVTVADTGCGIPEDLQERVFDLDVTSRGPGAGLGLGLPICKRIIEEHHGGSIDFDTRPGRTVVTVVVPKTAPSRETQP